MEASFWRWYYKRIMDSLHYGGPWALLWRIMQVCLYPVGLLGLVTYYQKDLTRSLPQIPTKIDLTIVEATKSDIERLVTLVKRRYGQSNNLEWYSKLGIKETIIQRFQRGCKCFVGRIGKEIIHYNWLFFDREEPVAGIGRFIYLKGDEALCDDAYTVEEWRGKAIHTAVQNQMLLFLRNQGYRKAYTAVGTFNKSSRKTHHRLAWEFSGTMLSFIPRGTKKAWIWRIRGSLDPFLQK